MFVFALNADKHCPHITIISITKVKFYISPKNIEESLKPHSFRARIVLKSSIVLLHIPHLSLMILIINVNWLMNSAILVLSKLFQQKFLHKAPFLRVSVQSSFPLLFYWRAYDVITLALKSILFQFHSSNVGFYSN